ncbi:MAG: NUDIX domain-containing protein [Anaerolineales bacterium]|nr:NUDIX domain-containing protein [Anaerolineales bacterium]MCB9145757.1 NUDIX domain-containing protein [Anaerolineales bacterium]
MADELLDVVNDNDEVTAQAMRSAVHTQGLWHRGVHVFLFNEQGDMLIQKRSADRKNSPSLLDCSVSEHVKAGESYLEAAVRGLQEEMGVAGIDLTLRGKIQMEYGVNDNEISIIYEGRLSGKSVQFDPVEIADVMFMSLDEIKVEIDRNPEYYCYWFIQLMKWYFGDIANLRELRL